ncbi:hypothetical protein DAEQUDRAFT_146891 [Daedalea quercina L-15889]|uniref:Uncharacterized protein n=1 Tax=Daedalea quercina L-15889 TaxID=1314783 RepID=A0A165KNJ3_9APHY|nr:hypothetical protein DAEQUDRAFT_146891 [Daedalea quercina L-15889]
MCLMEALGFGTIHLGETKASACSGSNGDSRCTADTGVPLMRALAFGDAEADEMCDGPAVCSDSGGGFTDSSVPVPLMKTMSVGAVKPGVVHSV